MCLKALFHVRFGCVQVIFNSAMALIMEFFSEPKRSEHLGLAVGLGSLGNVAGPPCMGALFDTARDEGHFTSIALLDSGWSMKTALKDHEKRAFLHDFESKCL